MKNVNQASRELLCEYNQLIILLKRHKVKLTKYGHANELYMPLSVYNKIYSQQEKIKSKLLPLDNLKSLKSGNIPISKDYYIYFLFDNDELVYIGQSCSLTGRISSHQGYVKEKKKEFNFVSVIQVPSTRVLYLEAFYIDKYKPKYNVSHLGGGALINYIFESLVF